MSRLPRQQRRLAQSARSKAVLQPPDFARLNIHPQQVSRLVEKGELVRVGYRRGAMPWDYADHELSCLCEECHERETHVRMNLREAMALLDEYDLQRLLGYAHGIILFSNMHDVAAYKLESLGEAEGMVAAVGATGVMAAYELLDRTVRPDHVVSAELLQSFYQSKRDSK